MAALTVLMPMAGLGSRFAAAAERTPKPLIEVDGIPMFRCALESVRSVIPDVRVIGLILAEHQHTYSIADRLCAEVPEMQVITLASLTGGALETCLAARPYTDGRAPLIVLDCDLTFRAASYFKWFESVRTGYGAENGMLLSFRSGESRYSYAELVDGRVIRTVEKQPISNHALIGAYGFGTAEEFFSAAQEIVDTNLRCGNGEFYVSSAYNYLIGRGATVRLVEAEAYWSMGTPEELALCRSDPIFLEHIAELRSSAETRKRA